MKRSVLVAQASPRGAAGHAGELIADVLANHGLAVDLKPATQVDLLDRYGAIVVGGPTRLGRWHRDARRFLQRHHTRLGDLPVAVFATEHHTTDHNNTIERALADTPEIEPITSAHFPTDPDSTDAIRRWAEELAHELGA